MNNNTLWWYILKWIFSQTVAFLLGSLKGLGSKKLTLDEILISTFLKPSKGHVKKSDDNYPWTAELHSYFLDKSS